MTGQTGPEIPPPQDTPPAGSDFDVGRDLLSKNNYPYLLDRLSRFVIKPRDSMDAIFVPAARRVSTEYVGRIATVARKTDTRFFTFVSHQADSGEMADLLDGMSLPEWWVVDVPNEGHELPFMKFKSPDAIPDHARKKPPSNLAYKRDLGLLVGKVMDWDRIIFSDDDVGYGPAALRAVSLMLPGHKIAGMQCGVPHGTRGRDLNGFPDKDVVHHALDRIVEIHSSRNVVSRPKAAGHISGNSIAANPQISGLVFPPEIYDEDLIGFYDMYVEGSAALALDAYYYQVPYDPFADPERVKWEAFGEYVHDGLYLPLWKDQTVDLTDPRHWNDTTSQRIRKIEMLLNGLDAPQQREYFTYMSVLSDRNPVYEAKIRQSLLGALAMNRSFSGIMGVDYLRAWSEDKTTYRNCVPQLPARQSIPDTLDWLGLSYRSNVVA